MNISTQLFSATYNCNAYGAGTYNNSDGCTTGTGTSPSSGNLADTGFDIWIPLILGAVLFIGGVALLVRRIVRRK